MPPIHILVVEDEFLIRATLVEMLQDEGFAVLEAETGDAALELLASGPTVQVLVTDMQLPGSLDGTRLAKAARELKPALPIIYVTGRPDSVRADERDGITVVGKPYTSAEIVAAVRRLVPAI